MYKVTVIGHLVADARLGNYGDRNVANFKIGAGTRFKGDDGQYMSNFPEVSVWGKSADFAATLKKGDKVMVMGDQCVKLYTDKNGKQGINIAITADTIEAMKPKQDSGDIFGS